MAGSSPRKAEGLPPRQRRHPVPQTAPWAGTAHRQPVSPSSAPRPKAPCTLRQPQASTTSASSPVTGASVAHLPTNPQISDHDMGSHTEGGVGIQRYPSLKTTLNKHRSGRCGLAKERGNKSLVRDSVTWKYYLLIMTKRMGMKGVFQKKVSLKRGGQGFSGMQIGRDCFRKCVLRRWVTFDQGFSGMQIGRDCFRKCVLRRWVTFGQGFSGMQTGTVSENASLEDG